MGQKVQCPLFVDRLPLGVVVSLLNYCTSPLCLQLHQISLRTQKEQNTDVHIEMVSYSAHLGFSHSSIYLDPNLSNVVR